MKIGIAADNVITVNVIGFSDYTNDDKSMTVYSLH